MRRAVRANEPGAVEHEAHGEMLERHVMDELIVAALQERGIDRREGLHSFGGKARRKRHRVLLGDADVEATAGKFRFENVDPGSRRHGRRDGDDPVVLAGLFDEAFPEDLRVAGRAAFALVLGACHDIELGHAVIFVGRVLRRLVAFALLGDTMDKHRPLVGIANIAQNGQQLLEIVPIDWADVINPKFLEQSAPGQKMPDALLGAGRAALPDSWATCAPHIWPCPGPSGRFPRR